jgi:CHAT domain-containing protein
VLQLVPQDQRQGTGADQGPSVTNGQAVAIESSNASIPVAVDFSATSVDVASSSEAQPPTLATGPVQTVLPEEQAGLQLQGSDAQATLRAVAALGLDETLDGLVPDSPSVGNIQQTLVEVQQQAQSGLAVVPAVLRVNFTEAQSGFLDLTLVPPKGAVQARRIEVSRARFSSLLKDLYRQLSRQESLDVANPESASRQLHQLLIAPMQSSLDAAGITTLLIAADQGLQAVPFSALSDGVSYFGDRYGFALSPSLALTDFRASTRSRGLLAMGASEFETLAPLPLVPQELSKIRDSATTDRYLNDGFTPRSFLERASDPRYSRVHVASHADFRPGGPEKSVLHTGVGPMSMADFAQLRRQRRDVPLDLVVLSACRTMLGDQDSELGFAGLALQAGARSAIGTLWYVDDVVTSAFFVQFYRFLSLGLPKAEALQRTRQVFALGSVYLKGDQVIGDGGEPLLQDLDQSQRRRIAGGVENPFFWAGIELIGSPW